jgi:hypothetical protein
MSSAESPSKLKKVINFILSLLALLKWVPFLGKWRPIILALSTVLGTLSAIKCDPPANKEEPKIDPTAPVQPHQFVRRHLHRPPRRKKLYLTEYHKQAGHSPSSTLHRSSTTLILWVDKWRLQMMGHDSRDGFMIAAAVVLNTPGKRVLTVRDLQGNILASKIIEVQP